MSLTVLDKIKAYKLIEIENDKKIKPLSDIEALAKNAPVVRPFAKALANSKKNSHSLIAEIKKASPSKGLIRKNFNPSKIAEAYESGGAACLSVLTDTPSFQGAKNFLNEAKQSTNLPALRKDFMYDTYQVAEARALNADCILVIMASVSDMQAQELEEAAFYWKMDVLLEVHDEEELERALGLNSKLIGINNRNLKTMEVDINTSLTLKKYIDPNKIIVAESGLKHHSDLLLLKENDIHNFLIGESLMKNEI